MYVCACYVLSMNVCVCLHVMYDKRVHMCACVHVFVYVVHVMCDVCLCVCVCVRMFVWCVCVHDCRGKATQAGRALSSGLRKAVLREHPPENEEETSPAALSQGHSGDRAPGPAWVTDAGLHRKVSLSCFTCFQSSS